ncbi:MAG: flagellar filament capping protein FliD [Lachnospiraceae bacterium]|nr:flagellar filament capping protein FliD [Lachnospiraceae bacterium]
MGQIRMSGLISGLDTDSIISQLVSVKRSKVNTEIGNRTKLSWKQDIWKDLNKELKTLKSTAEKMRFTSAYTKKAVRASDSSKVSVTAADGTTDSVQSLKISNLAKTAYLTGGVINSTSGDSSSLTALSKLSDIGITEDTSITLTDKNGNATGKVIDLKADGTISDVLSQLKSAGLNASFDANNQRFFISAKSSGADADFGFTGDDSALAALGLKTKGEGDEDSDAYATKVDGADAVIYLNDAKFTSKTNLFEINGLSITALEETGNEKITLTTETDTSGVYDAVKNYLKTYNSIINKLDSLYNAESAKGYNPLTDEEKDALSDKEVEEYEKKIKDSLLRKDESVNTLIKNLTGSVSQGYTVGGKTMYLSNFGIGTLNYFTAEENERHALHIDGDEDDENTSGNTDKLLAAIKSDPNSVVSFFTQMSQDLYTKMNKLSSSSSNRTYGKFYEDKKMANDYENYKTKISDMEEKVNDYEDKLYKQYAAMEKALASLQSKSNALSGLIGSGG